MALNLTVVDIRLHTEHTHDYTKDSIYNGLLSCLWIVTGSSEDYKATNLSLNSLNNTHFLVF
jgi:hypothetical protein